MIALLTYKTNKGCILSTEAWWNIFCRAGHVFFLFFVFLSGFSFTDTDDSQDSRGRERTIFLFHSTTSTRSRTLRHLFATLHVRWLSRIFNCNASVYQTATRWNSLPYWINIWLIDWCNACLFNWWNDSRFLLQRFWDEKPVDPNLHQLSAL